MSIPTPRSRKAPAAAVVLAVVVSVLAGLLAALGPGPAGAAPAAEPGDDPASVARDLERLLRTEERTDFWVAFSSDAALDRAAGYRSWAAQGRFVVEELRQTARASQHAAIELLDRAGVDYTPYWITNAIRVHAGDYLLAHTLARLPSVERVFAPVEYVEPEPVTRNTTPSRIGPSADGVVEWGVHNIKADQVWDTYGVRGDGVVVATIDSGVQVDHPALANSYRGFDQATGTFHNDYNWFDVTGSSPYPTDDNGHGTHTMGTILGDDGGANQIGVAPGAQWIAANGCCPSDEALLRSAQWMLAPTRVDGSDPDPSKRPDIVNNSWGSIAPSTDPFLDDIFEAWTAAGIFGVFANGNAGESGCNTSGTPGSRTLNYSVGAYDDANQIASFSARGPGQDGSVKPDISAPGYNIRSAVPGGRYDAMSGTSMAAPHVAGAVALLWAARPDLVGDIAGTRELLDSTAIDTPDGQCGGTGADNNVYGEGRLDALALVGSAGQGDIGTASGTVLDAETGTPVRGAVVRLDRGDLVRSARTSDDGSYRAEIPVGTYQATVVAFGYDPATVEVTIAVGEETSTEIRLAPVEGHTVTGRVVDKMHHRGVPYAKVALVGSRFSTVTDAQGRFTINRVPGPADYVLTVDAGGGCNRPGYRTVHVARDVALADVVLGNRIDQPIGDWSRGMTDGPGGTVWGDLPPYGYRCSHEPTKWIEGRTEVRIPEFSWVGHDITTKIPLPFPMTYFGRTYRNVYVNREGHLSFWLEKTPAPPPYLVDEGLWSFWAGAVDERTRMLTRTTGTAPNRAFTVEYQDAFIDIAPPGTRLSFEVTLHEDGDIVFAYKDVDAGNLYEEGANAEIRLHGEGRNSGQGASFVFDYSDEAPVIDDRRQIRFELPPAGFVEGRVVDERTGAAVPGADVTLVSPTGNELNWVETDRSGRYRLEVLAGGRHTIRVTDAPGYRRTKAVQVEITRDRQVLRTTTRLAPATFGKLPDRLVVRRGRAATFRLTNRGTERLQWRMETTARLRARPPAGSLVGTHATGVGLTAGIEEVDDTLWVAAANYATRVPWRLVQTTRDGAPTGNEITSADLALEYGFDETELIPGDLAWVPSRGWMCTVANLQQDILCLDAETSEATALLPTGFGDAFVVRGLAYDEERDLFYVEGDGNGTLHQIRTLTGPEHAYPGRQVGSCIRLWTNGLAWDPVTRSLWTRGGYRELRQVDPVTCTEVRTVRTPASAPDYARVSDVDEDGDVITFPAWSDTLSEFAATDPWPGRVPWIRLSESRGSVAPGRSKTLTVRVDWSRVPPGTKRAWLVLRGNGGRRTKAVVPIRLVR